MLTHLLSTHFEGQDLKFFPRPGLTPTTAGSHDHRNLALHHHLGRLRYFRPSAIPQAKSHERFSQYPSLWRTQGQMKMPPFLETRLFMIGIDLSNRFQFA